jgi:hypothetical protein
MSARRKVTTDRPHPPGASVSLSSVKRRRGLERGGAQLPARQLCLFSTPPLPSPLHHYVEEREKLPGCGHTAVSDW